MWAVGDTYRFSFQTTNTLGAPTDADSLPTGQLVVNGTATAAAVTITDSGTGWYRGSVSLAGLGVGNTFEVEVTAVIGGTTYILGMGEQRISLASVGSGGAETGTASKLDAVNEVLESVGLSAVASLDTGNTSEEGEAEAIIDRYTTRVLRRGWACNTADERTYTPSGGNIDMSGVFSFTSGKYGDRYAIKDGLLYDPVDDTIAFTASVTLTDVVFSISFGQIPEHIQNLIVAESKVAFVRFKRQDADALRLYLAEREEAKREANVVDARIKNVNLYQTADAYLTRGYPHGQR